MSAFDCLVIWTLTTLILILSVHIVLLVSTSASPIIVAASFITSSHSHSIVSSHSIASATFEISSHSSTHSHLSSSSSICLVAVLHLNWFQSKIKLILSQWIFGFSEFFIPMCEVAAITKNTISMRFEMPTSLRLVFWIYLVLLLLSYILHHVVLIVRHTIILVCKPGLNLICLLHHLWLLHCRNHLVDLAWNTLSLLLLAHHAIVHPLHIRNGHLMVTVHLIIMHSFLECFL